MRTGRLTLGLGLIVILSVGFGLNPSLGEAESVQVEHVHIQGNAFSPDLLTVRPGDEVEWHNHDGVPHTATADNNDWNTGTINNGESQSLTFDESGTWTYHCAFHPGMAGTLIVNALPTVTLDAPGDGSSVDGTVTIEGTAADPDGNVDEVELRIDGGDWQTTSGTADWTYQWNTQQASNGPHTIEVRAFDGTEHSGIETIALHVDNPQVLDLEIRAEDIEATMDPVESQIDVTVRNQGNQAAPSFPLLLEYTYNEEVYTIGEVEVDGLTGFSSQIHRFSWDTLGKVGDFEITASADREGTSGDSDPTNNDATVTVSVLVDGVEGVDLLSEI